MGLADSSTEFIVGAPVAWTKLFFITQASEYFCALNVLKYLHIKIANCMAWGSG